MSTVESRDASDDLEHQTAGVRVLPSVPARSGGWLREDEDEDDLYGEDDLGFDDIDEEDDDEDKDVGDLDEDDELDEVDDDIDDD
jgi:hypothetical protein